MTVELHLGDCLTVMRTLDENSVDTCITDPPYELGFMGKRWDSSGVAFQVETWQAVFRVLKPGAILLAFGGTRTYHRMVCAIEDAGFEIRDTIAWIYGSGFPKSYDISKGIDKQAGAKREVIGEYQFPVDSDKWAKQKAPTGIGIPGAKPNKASFSESHSITAPATPEAQLWHGWGTALKPAFEPIVVAMKPIDGTYAENALKWGVAGYWIDGGRVGIPEGDDTGVWGSSNNACQDGRIFNASPDGSDYRSQQHPQGRFPANLIHDGSDEVVGLFPQNTGAFAPVKKGQKAWGGEIYGKFAEGGDDGKSFYGDGLGSAARFFYCAKASRSERNAGLEGMEERESTEMTGRKDGSAGLLRVRNDGSIGENPYAGKSANAQNHHPTVKPISLMRYLVRLTKTPTGGIVLDPFMGSGSTGCACVLEGRDFIGIEREQDYIEIADKRIEYWARQPKLELT